MECCKSEVKWFTLTNASGASVMLSNLGAGIVAVNVPDKDGVVDNVVLNYANGEDYYADGPCSGKIPGRFANRIAGGKFTLDGVEYQLAVNNGPNHLHGGPQGQTYANRIWKAEQSDGSVTFSLDSPDGDAGYPGNLKVEACYKWSEDNCLTLTITAETDKATPVNFTNHVYFDLRGSKNFGGEGCEGHLLKLNASRYLPTDSTLIPTGELAPVAGTPMDFTAPKAIGTDLHNDFPALNYGKGYDACFCIDDFDGTVKEAAVLEAGGRRVVLSTNQPGVQIYTGCWLAGCPASPDDYAYKDYDAVAMECQAFPDSPNKPEFPYKPLRPGEKYVNVISWKFE
ncbi:MAG: galactose mutarotase [Bacteroidales bacterium]|nr:galactose mutarotase [Bacteroidales bacterium]